MLINCVIKAFWQSPTDAQGYLVHPDKTLRGRNITWASDDLGMRTVWKFELLSLRSSFFVTVAAQSNFVVLSSKVCIFEAEDFKRIQIAAWEMGFPWFFVCTHLA